MLFLAKCRQCAFLIANPDILAFKQALIKHRMDSHQAEFLLASTTRVGDFKDEFFIHRYKDKDVQTQILLSLTTKAFWKAQRTPIVSVRTSGES